MKIVVVVMSRNMTKKYIVDRNRIIRQARGLLMKFYFGTLISRNASGVVCGGFTIIIPKSMLLIRTGPNGNKKKTLFGGSALQ